MPMKKTKSCITSNAQIGEKSINFEETGNLNLVTPMNNTVSEDAGNLNLVTSMDNSDSEESLGICCVEDFYSKSSGDSPRVSASESTSGSSDFIILDNEMECDPQAPEYIEVLQSLDGLKPLSPFSEIKGTNDTKSCESVNASSEDSSEDLCAQGTNDTKSCESVNASSEDSSEDSCAQHTDGHTHDLLVPKYSDKAKMPKAAKKCGTSNSRKKMKNHSFDRWKNFNLKYVIYSFIILNISALLNLTALSWESEALQPEGERVNMGYNQKMFINCKGDGLPTVILDAPTGLTSDVWLTAQEQIAKFTQVCVYDRAGLGFSDPPNFYKLNEVMSYMDPNLTRRFVADRSTVGQMVEDLHYLITVAKPLPRPLMLIGAEVSSLVATYYAQMYPEEIAGIVLINPSVKNVSSKFVSVLWDHFYSTCLEFLITPILCGINRILFSSGLVPVMFKHSISEEVMRREYYLQCNPSHLFTSLEEHFVMGKSSLQTRELLESNSFPQNISMAILNSDETDEPGLNDEKNEFLQFLGFHSRCEHLYMGINRLNQFFNQPAVLVNYIQKRIFAWRIFNHAYVTYMYENYEKLRNSVISYVTFHK